MRVEVKENNHQKYPCLMENEHAIIFVTGKGAEGYDGVKVFNKNGCRLAGDIQKENWFDDSFKPFNGTITLSND